MFQISNKVYELYKTSKKYNTYNKEIVNHLSAKYDVTTHFIRISINRDRTLEKAIEIKKLINK